jgi:superfamily II DNA/RNA helicase
LITTDVWARGIDVQQVSLVINYDLPASVMRPFFCLFLPLNIQAEIEKIIFTGLVDRVGSVAKALLLTCVFVDFLRIDC